MPSKERAAGTVAFGHPGNWPDLSAKDVLSSRRPSFVNGAGWTFCLRGAEANYCHPRAWLIHFMKETKTACVLLTGESQPWAWGNLARFSSLFSAEHRTAELPFAILQQRMGWGTKVLFCFSYL